MKTNRQLFKLAHLLLLSAFLSGCAGQTGTISANTQSKPKLALAKEYENVDQGRVFVVAHRGCWTHAPENSIPSVQNCVKLGVEVIEIDVQLTADKQLVVFHDKTVDRMTGETGSVSEMTLAELKALKLYERDGSDAQLFAKPLKTNESIPTLAEVLQAARGHLMINLEIKSSGFSWQETFAAAAELTKQMDMADHVLWKIKPPVRGNSKNMSANVVIEQLDVSGLPYLMPIVWQSSRGHEQQLADFGKNVTGFEIIAQDPNYWPLAADGRIIGADKYRFMGIAVLPRWSAGYSDDIALHDPDAAWGKLLQLGADLIMTDRPEQLISYLKSKGLR